MRAPKEKHPLLCLEEDLIQAERPREQRPAKIKRVKSQTRNCQQSAYAKEINTPSAPSHRLVEEESSVGAACQAQVSYGDCRVKEPGRNLIKGDPLKCSPRCTDHCDEDGCCAQHHNPKEGDEHEDVGKRLDGVAATVVPPAGDSLAITRAHLGRLT